MCAIENVQSVLAQQGDVVEDDKSSTVCSVNWGVEGLEIVGRINVFSLCLFFNFCKSVQIVLNDKGILSIF